MPFTLQDLIYGGLLPGLAAALLWSLFGIWSRGEFLRRLGHSLSFVGGFHVGYWLLSLGDAAPESHWEWLPWVLPLSCLGAVPPARNTGRHLARSALIIAVAIASALLIVPTWEHLDPAREIHLAVLTVGIVFIAVLLEPLTQQLTAWKLLVVLAAVLTSAAAILALSGSLRFAQIAGCGVGAVAGMAVAATRDRNTQLATGIALPYAVLAAAIMLIGRVNSFSDVPLVSYLLPPLAPLTLCAVAGPLSASKGLRHWLALAMPLVVCLLAIVLAAMAGE